PLNTGRTTSLGGEGHRQVAVGCAQRAERPTSRGFVGDGERERPPSASRPLPALILKHLAGGIGGDKRDQRLRGHVGAGGVGQYLSCLAVRSGVVVGAEVARCVGAGAIGFGDGLPVVGESTVGGAL